MSWEGTHSLPSTTTLITGGAGFIGSHLAERLVSQGRHVTILDDLSTGHANNLSHLPRGTFDLIEGSVGTTLPSRPGLLDGVSHVYHLAATVGVGLVIDNPAAMIQNNVRETAALLDACDGRGVTVLITSSSEVYGQSQAMPLAEDSPLVFGSTSIPRWSYGMTKALDEHLALAHHARGTLRAVIVRLFNTIGARQVGHYGMVVPRFISAAIKGRDLEIHGDGNQTRCFCDVRDVVAAMSSLMDDPRSHGRAYNVGSDEEITIGSLADRVIALSGSRSGKRHVPYTRVYGERFADPQRRVPDLSRIRGAIGYRPGYSLDDTLRELIDQARHAVTDAPALGPTA